jgi:hypothetical protein
MLAKDRENSPIDFLYAGLFFAAFITYITAFQYHGVFAETDLYRELIGVIDGAVTARVLVPNSSTGETLASDIFVRFMNFVPNAILLDPEKVTKLINDVGYYSIIIGSFFFWLSVLLAYGSRAALAALALYAFSPLLLEMGTSGHQMLAALAFLWAAAACLFWPLSGWRAFVAATAATVLLICGLTMRAEIVLAFPFLALARVNLSSFRAFVRPAAINAVSPAVASIVFLR